MRFQYNDGGRLAAGFKGQVGDCVARSIAIATGLPYLEVYDAINILAKSERRGKRKRGISSARDGVFKETYRKYIKTLGWTWVPTMQIGSGCRVHLHDGELPDGRLIVCVSRHVTAVINGVVHDTHDPQRSFLVCADDMQRVVRRCVYGYFHKGSRTP